MITLGAKVYFGLCAFALAAATVLGLASGGTLLGIISFGWSGPIGDNLGFTVLVAVSAGAFFMGTVTTAFRDADATAVEQLVGSETLPAALPPAHLSPWPVVAAFGVAGLMIGFVVEPAVVGLSILLLVIAAIEWGVTAWADQATGDPDANAAIRNRIMSPIEVPAMAVLGIGVFVFLSSRLLLSASKWGAIIFFSGMATLILIAAVLVAARPVITRGVLTALLLFGGVSLVVGGVVGLGLGQREFHDLSEEGHDEEHATDEEHSESEDQSESGDDTTSEDGSGDDDMTSGDSEE
jgi:hypothetical protein